MNIGKVYTPPTFIARGIYPSKGGIGARDEYWCRPSKDSSHGPYTNVEGMPRIVGGCRTFKDSSHGLYTSLGWMR